MDFIALEAAAKTLKGAAHRTPVLTNREFDKQAGAEVFFKCENFQRTGSFKFRGAYNALSNLPSKHLGVVTFSSGNHAQAIALAGSTLGVRVIVIMPNDSPAVKQAATRGYGAEVVLYDRHLESREKIAEELVDGYGWQLIPPFNHPDIIAGQGTAALELIEEVGPLDYLFVGVGGGGLISGSVIAASAKLPNCVVIGVEPQAGNDAQLSLQRGEIVSIPVPHTIADGAMTTALGTLTFPIIRDRVREIVTVSDQDLLCQMRFFAERMKMVVEPTGCLAAAAVINRKIDITGARVGVLVSGGNVDLSLFAHPVLKG